MKAILLLAIAGLDIIPNLIFDAVFSFTGAGTVYASSEWWNNQGQDFRMRFCGSRITSPQWSRASSAFFCSCERAERSLLRSARACALHPRQGYRFM